jgi:hypothetical protein
VSNEAPVDTRSRTHRWLERILAFGGLGYWLLSVYAGLAFAAALLTTLTLPSVIRIYAELVIVLGAFGALIAHRFRPSAARLAHWTMLAAAVVMFGSCAELVELPPHYRAFEHRAVQVEFADDGVGREEAVIRDLIDQVYSRSGLPQATSPVRMRFVKNTGGRLVRVGDWTDAGEGGADIVLTTNRGATRGTDFLLEGAFLLTDALARRLRPDAQSAARGGFAYWTMLGITPPPQPWVTAQRAGATARSCADIAAAASIARPDELTIWWAHTQPVLRVNAWPFVDAERTGGTSAAQALFQSPATADFASWRATVQQHCAPRP